MRKNTYLVVCVKLGEKIFCIKCLKECRLNNIQIMNSLQTKTALAELYNEGLVVTNELQPQ